MAAKLERVLNRKISYHWDGATRSNHSRSIPRGRCHGISASQPILAVF